MKKKIVIAVLVLATVTGICFGTYYHSLNSMASLPQGDFLCESMSPQGTYTVKLYESPPVALSVGCTRGELVINKSGKTRNIYWEYNRNLFEAGLVGDEILWEEDDIVIINGRYLTLPHDTYDFRQDWHFGRYDTYDSLPWYTHHSTADGYYIIFDFNGMSGLIFRGGEWIMRFSVTDVTEDGLYRYLYNVLFPVDRDAFGINYPDK